MLLSIELRDDDGIHQLIMSANSFSDVASYIESGNRTINRLDNISNSELILITPNIDTCQIFRLKEISSNVVTTTIIYDTFKNSCDYIETIQDKVPINIVTQERKFVSI
jgi:hypothetical protein